MNFSFSALAAGFVFGICGLYLFRFAKKQQHVPNIAIGVALMIYPYFIQNEYVLWGAGFALLFLAYQLRD